MIYKKSSRCVLVKSFKQNYLSYVYHGTPIKLPAVHIKVFNPKEKNNLIKSFALVDSGATVSFVPLELAQVLNLKFKETSTATGAGGDFDTYIATVKIEVFKASKTVYKEAIKVHIPQEEEKIPYIVLGRDSIFQHFDIKFVENKKHIIFRRSTRF